jgi:hypothetical protein
MMTLYKAGGVWMPPTTTRCAAGLLDVIGPKKDFWMPRKLRSDYYNFNTTSGPTKDLRVRKALNMSVDKKRWPTGGHVQALTAMDATEYFQVYPQPKGDPFDPEKAKEAPGRGRIQRRRRNFDPKKFGSQRNRTDG